MNQFGDITINDAVAMAALLNGRQGISAVLTGRSDLPTAKYGEMTLGQNEALVNNLGGMEVVEAILRGEKEVSFKDVVVKLFDKRGRRIPPRVLNAAVTDANRSYHLKHTKIDHAARLDRLFEYLGGGKAFISTAEFEDRSEAIMEGLRKDDRTMLLANAVHLPFALPLTEVNDYGQVLDETFLPAVQRSYGAQFPERTFTNHRAGTLAKQVTIVEGTRHERFVEAMTQGVIVGQYFPNCLQGFSVHADREQMTTLPEKFLLAGGFDSATCMIGYPDILAKDGNTPLLDCAALQWQSAEYSLFFYAGDDRANFGRRANLGHASGSDAGGLVVLG